LSFVASRISSDMGNDIGGSGCQNFICMRYPRVRQLRPKVGKGAVHSVGIYTTAEISTNDVLNRKAVSGIEKGNPLSWNLVVTIRSF